MQSSRHDVAHLDCLLDSFSKSVTSAGGLGLHDAGHAGHAGVANRTAKGSICRISAFFAEMKALFGRGDLSLRTSIVQPVFEHPLNR